MWLISLGFGFGKTKAVRCYVTLLVWIIVVSLALYWFLNRSSSSGSNWTEKRWSQKKVFHSYEDVGSHDAAKEIRWKISKKFPISKAEGSTAISIPLHSSVHRLCNHPEGIQFDEENLQVPEFKLDAAVIIFRHGDRGPLSHVGSQNLSTIDCSSDHPDFQKFFQFSQDSMAKLGGYSQFIGPFHSFPKVPTSKQCHLGQLSQLGAGQLIQLGKIIQSAYRTSLFSSPTSVPLEPVNTSSLYHPLQNIKVIAYSTRYRRTLQSLLAFLYGLLGPKLIIPNVSIRESQSINFCFNDCSCRATERLKKLAAKKYQPSQSDKLKMISLVDRVNAIMGSEKTRKSGTTLLDLLLVYSCHRSELPCQSKTVPKKIYIGSSPDDCISSDDISALIQLLQKENHYQKQIEANRQLYLLTSYGLLKEITNIALKMTSSNSGISSLDNSGIGNTPFSNTNGNGGSGRTKVAIFSGHDTTLQSLTGALGIYSGHPDIHLVPYASRLIFEFYRKTNVPPNSARKHYFRVVYNGQAVTHLVRFCTADKVVALQGNSNGKTTQSPGYSVLCPLENLVRFLHDHYFENFGNATNFKDACQKTGKKRKK